MRSVREKAFDEMKSLVVRNMRRRLLRTWLSKGVLDTVSDVSAREEVLHACATPVLSTVGATADATEKVVIVIVSGVAALRLRCTATEPCFGDFRLHSQAESYLSIVQGRNPK